MGLSEPRTTTPGGGRKQMIRLSKKGWALYNRTRPAFEAQEKKMLKTLSVGEQHMLSELMTKIVIRSEDWAGELPPEAMIDTETWTEGNTL